MGIAQIDELAASIKNFKPKSIATEAIEVGPDENAKSSCTRAPNAAKVVSGEPRAICIVFDRSSSMLSKDCGGDSRFNVCKKSIDTIFENNVEDHDMIGLYTFEDHLKESFP